MIMLFSKKPKKKHVDEDDGYEDEVDGMASIQSIKSLAAMADNNQTSASWTESLAKKETQAVNVFRYSVLAVLVLAAILASTGVYLYTRNQEESNFKRNFEDSAQEVIESFHDAVERNLAAVASLSNAITSYSLQSNQSFPFVTLPDFEVIGSDVRAHSGSHLIHWCPLVTDDNREVWEDYAQEARSHASESIQQEKNYRWAQDLKFGTFRRERQLATEQQQRHLQQQSGSTNTPTILDDGTNYHPHIWSNGAKLPPGDIPNGKGKYLPLWQQSPADPRLESALNIDVSAAALLSDGIIETMESEHKALLHVTAEPADERAKAQFEYYLSLSQYRHLAEELSDDFHTLLTYPVFDTFENDAEMVGIISTDIYWKVLLSNLLRSNLQGIICVIENDFGQSFAYQIDGPTATALGMDYQVDTKYENLAVSTNVNTHLTERASAVNRAYKTRHLSDKVQYTIHVYPSSITREGFLTKEPGIYMTVTLFAFIFASLMFLLYSYVVERRQKHMTARVVENAKHAAQTERELNEFLSHEIRNPLSAAISACTFVSTAVNESKPLQDEESINYVREDIEVVNSSLHFINDFLRSMLDIYRAAGNKITVDKAPTDVKQDILEPVSNILYKRLNAYDVVVDCPDDLVVMTDSIRLKQVILNLVRNASKFVEKGFLRMRAAIVEGPNGYQSVKVFVEDSGPGITPAKREEIFAKYQESLDLLQQGTGIGLNLSKKLMRIMEGDLYLDDDYHSGIEGSPGACFVVDLRTPPLDMNFDLDADIEAAVMARVDIEAGMASGTSGSKGMASGTSSASLLQYPINAMLSSNRNRNAGAMHTEAMHTTTTQDEHSTIRSDSSPGPSDHSSVAPDHAVSNADTEASLAPPEEKKAEAPPPTQEPAPPPATASPTTTKTALFALPPPKAPPIAVGASNTTSATATSHTNDSNNDIILPEGMSVLFVDDDAMLRKLFMRAVKRVAPTSWKITEASSGEMALKLCDPSNPDEHPDMIFLDQYMASVDKQLLGTETALAMRQMGIRSRICGLSANDLRDAFINSGADDFILKPMPCKPVELKKTLLRILGPGKRVSKIGRSFNPEEGYRWDDRRNASLTSK